MNDAWNEWGPRVPDPRMIGLRRATPGRPARELFPISPRHRHGDILSDPPEQDQRTGHRAPAAADSAHGRVAHSVTGHHAGPLAAPAPGGAHAHLAAPVADRQPRWAADHHVRWGDRARHGHERPGRAGTAVPPADGLMDGPTMKVTTSGEIVRPFIMTAGRTRPLDERLRIETLLSATPAALTAPLAFEHAHIVELCREPTSVAEIAAGLRLPVGIARLLIADLVTERYLVIHAQIVPGARPPRELLERIRAGVRAL